MSLFIQTAIHKMYILARYLLWLIFCFLNLIWPFKESSRLCWAHSIIFEVSHYGRNLLVMKAQNLKKETNKKKTDTQFAQPDGNFWYQPVFVCIVCSISCYPVFPFAEIWDDMHTKDFLCILHEFSCGQLVLTHSTYQGIRLISWLQLRTLR